MRLLRLLTAAGISVALLWLGPTAEAAYNSKYDINLRLNVAPSLIKPSGTTGKLTFEAQEAVHEALTDMTGLSVDHFYVWIYVNDQPVAAIDPLCFYDFGGGKTTQ